MRSLRNSRAMDVPGRFFGADPVLHPCWASAFRASAAGSVPLVGGIVVVALENVA